MNYKIVVCDDNPEILKQTTEILQHEFDHGADLRTFDSLEELRRAYEGGVGQPDILIMDISWDDAKTGALDNKGVDTAEWLQKKYPTMKCVFVTGFAVMSPEIFKAKPTDLVLKPIGRDKLCEAVQRCIAQIEAENAATVSFQISGEYLSLRAVDILYLESVNHELHIITPGKEYKVWMKMDDALKKMPEDSFLRVHQSYAVNLGHIGSFSADGVVLSEGTRLPISKKRYKVAKQDYLRYLGEC